MWLYRRILGIHGSNEGVLDTKGLIYYDLKERTAISYTHKDVRGFSKSDIHRIMGRQKGTDEIASHLPKTILVNK